MSDTTIEKRAKRRRRFGRIFTRKWASGRRTWSAQWFDQTKSKRVTRHFDSESLAKDFLDALELQIVARTYQTPPSQAEAMAMPLAVEAPEVPSFVAYAENLLKARLAATLRPSTLGLYSANLLALSMFYGAKDDRPAARLDEITIPSFHDYRSFRMTSRHSPNGSGGVVMPSTVNRDGQFASRVLTEAVLDGHIPSNPLRGLKKLKEPRLPRRYLAKDEVRLLIRNCSPRFRPLVVAALFTGCRKSELVRMRWSDISFTEAKIAVYRVKTGTSDMLDLHPALALELKALRARQNQTKRVADGDHIFLSKRGCAYTNVTKSWRLAIHAAGLEGRPGLTFHALRHTHATHFLEGGGSTTDLMAQLGHKSLSTTERYAAMVSARRRASVLALDFGKRSHHRAVTPEIATKTRATPKAVNTKPHAAARGARRSA